MSLLSVKYLEDLPVVNSAALLTSYIDSPTKVILGNYVYKYNSSSTATVDNILTIGATGKGSGRWEIDIPDQRITPELFGAVGDGTTDDTAALTAWITAPGTWNLEVGAKTYISTASLVRTDLGACTIMGAGVGKSKIIFTGDTDGIKLVNPENGNYGALVLTGFEILSGGDKSIGTLRAALTITSQHLSRPGPVVHNMSFRSIPTTQQWGAMIHIHDCSGVSGHSIDMQSGGYNANLARTTGILITNTNNKPCVEHNFSHINMRNVKYGMDIAQTGTPGIEGVQFTDSTIAGCMIGVRAINTAGSPYLGFNQVHINSFGYECVHLEKYQQITFNGCLFYCNASQDPTPVIPVRAVYIKDTIICTGNIMYSLTDNIPNVVEFDGTGGGIDLDLNGTVASAQSHVVKVPAGYLGSTFGLGRLWNGNTTWGTTQGDGVDPTSTAVRVKFTTDPLAFYPSTDQSRLSFDLPTGLWKALPPAQANGLVYTSVSATGTIDPAQTNVVRVFNGANNITLTIDHTRFGPGQVFYVTRGDGSSTGTITLTTDAPGTNKIMDATGQYNATFLVPNLTGQKQVGFFYNGTHLQLLTYGVSSVLVPTIAPAAFSTATWSTGTYTEVIAPGVLQLNTIYLVKSIFDQPGTDYVVQSWMVPIANTNSASTGTVADLTGNLSIYSVDGGRYIKLREKRPSSGGGTFGLEAALSISGMSSGATVTLTIAPIF